MSSLKEIYLTEEGWRKLQGELSDLLSQRDSRSGEYAQIADDIEWGKAASPTVQSIGVLDRRIADLEKVLSLAVPVGLADRQPGIVGVGSCVAVRWDDGEEESYTLVGPPEVDLPAGKISYQSPVGRVLMGRQRDESVEVETPGGIARLRLLEVR